MNPFVAGAQLLGNLAGLGQQFGALSNPRFDNGNFIAALTTSMGGDAGAAALSAGQMLFKAQLMRPEVMRDKIARGFPEDLVEYCTAKWQDYAKDPYYDKPFRERAFGANIIAWTIAVVDGLELLTGFGPPDEGDALRVGSQQFTGLARQLGSAVPDEGWQGEASRSYAARNTWLQGLALALADLDTKLADLVTGQAAQVTNIRLAFGVLKDLLALALAIELVFRTSGLTASALGLAIAACALGITAALAMLATLFAFSYAQVDQADALTTTYTEDAASAASTGVYASTQVAAAVSSRVGAVEARSVSLTAAPAIGAVSEGHRMRGSHPGEEEAPDTGVPVPAVVGLPALAQLRAWSGQPAPGISLASLVDQTSGQRQRVTGRPAAATESNLTDDAATAPTIAEVAEDGMHAPLRPVGAQELRWPDGKNSTTDGAPSSHESVLPASGSAIR